MKNIKDIEKENYKDNIYQNEDLSKYSWFNLGGKAEIFFRPKNNIQLSLFLKNNLKKISVLGLGSNTLIRDGGVKGVTIKLSSKYSYMELLDNEIIQVGAATLDKKLSDFAVENSLSGFEFLSCIPGSVGGAIIMNSGCYDCDISEILISIEVMDYLGQIKTIEKKDINFIYRGTNLSKDLIILSAKFKGKKGDPKKIKQKQIQLIQQKKKDQPSKVKTCGSTFKNPSNQKAWKLIKESNCENMKVGKAKMSEKHCNFFINDGGSKSSEIEELIIKVKNQVMQKTGIELELELKILGSNN